MRKTRSGKSAGFAGGYRLLSGSPALLSRRRSRRGVTLLELLVVMLILLMVTAAALPIVVPAMQNRQMRESARLVSSYLSVARSRAIEIGRPVGVMVERFNGQPFGMVLSQVEVPPPYSGDYVDSQMTVTVDPMAGATHGQITAIGSGGSPDELWKGLVRYGDLIKLNYHGPVYILTSVPGGMVDPLLGQAIPAEPGSTNWFLQTTGGLKPTLPVYGTVISTLTLPYQIIRRPTRSSTTPLQLPEGIVVDLVSSGMGAGGYWGIYTSPNWSMPFDPIVLFDPSGRLASVSQPPQGNPATPNDAVYLLLGRRDLMPDVTATQIDRNLSELPTSPPATMTPPPHFWVSVGYQTGLVTVAEVAANCQDTSQGFDVALGQSRLFARQSQSVGGR